MRLIAGLRGVLGDPFAHFIIFGACLAAAAHFVNAQDGADMQTILVDRNRLLTYMQYQAGAFDKAQSGAALDNLPQAELLKLIDDYVREEALYREAKALQLDQGDYVARLRLIQQLKFVLQGFPDDAESLSEAEIGAYYAAHKAAYQEAPAITFAHVFINRRLHGKQTKDRANRTLEILNARQVPFTEAMRYGDRFYYQVNYVRADADLVGSHFDRTMQQQLFALRPDENRWAGPFESPYGYHLVMLTDHIEGYTPPLSQVRNRVAQDAFQARETLRLDQAVANIAKTYKVQLSSLRASGNGPAP